MVFRFGSTWLEEDKAVARGIQLFRPGLLAYKKSISIYDSCAFLPIASSVV